MDQLGRKLLEYLRAGADPRRISGGLPHKGARDISVTAHIKTMAATARYGAVGGIIFGCLFSALVIAATAAITDLRPASVEDIRIAVRVRAAIPNPETLSQSDLVARLTVPPKVVSMLAPLADLDPSKETAKASWLAAISGHQPLVVDPGRMQALARLATSLSASTYQQADIDFIMELYRAFDSGDAIAILRAIVDLSPAARTELAQTNDLARILEEMAQLPRGKRHQLLGAGLSVLLPDNEDRANLLRLLPTLDLPIVQLLLHWRNVGNTQRQVLIYVLGRIETSDPTFSRLISGFYVGNQTLHGALKSLPAACGYNNVEACR